MENFCERIKKSVWIVLFVASMVSCGKSSKESQRVLRINIQDEPQTLDPRKARDLSAVTLLHMLFEGLARVGKEGSAECALAEEMRVSSDGLTYTFRLRPTRWSNGESVTSYDFAYAWRRILDPRFPTDVACHLFVVKGAKEAKLGKKTIDQIGIYTPTPEILVVELEQPTPYFLELLTYPAFFPVPAALASKNPHWAESHLDYVSNGPFLLKKWEHSNKIEVVSNSFYWDAEHVQLKEIEMVMVNPETELRMFQNSQLDWAGSPLSTLPPDSIECLKKTKNFQIKPLTGTFFLRINTLEDSPLAHPLFRRALAFAIDRKSLTEHILQGGQLPATEFVPPTMDLSTEGYFPDNSEKKAMDLFSLYLELEQKSLEDLPSITLLYVTGERNQSIALAMKQQIEDALPLSIHLEAVERKMYYDRLSKKRYQIAACSWIADFNDPINFLEIFKYKEGGMNHTGWENPKYIEYLNRSALCNNPMERKKALQEAESLLMDQMPVIPIYHYALNYLQRPELQDICLSPIGQIDFRWCRFDQHSTQ